jgi:hypothetical protein
MASNFKVQKVNNFICVSKHYIMKKYPPFWNFNTLEWGNRYPVKAVVLKLWGATPKGGVRGLKGGRSILSYR